MTDISNKAPCYALKLKRYFNEIFNIGYITWSYVYARKQFCIKTLIQRSHPLGSLIKKKNNSDQKCLNIVPLLQSRSRGHDHYGGNPVSLQLGCWNQSIVPLLHIGPRGHYGGSPVFLQLGCSNQSIVPLLQIRPLGHYSGNAVSLQLGCCNQSIVTLLQIRPRGHYGGNAVSLQLGCCNQSIVPLLQIRPRGHYGGNPVSLYPGCCNQ
jgi:hypothetical protein